MSQESDFKQLQRNFADFIRKKEVTLPSHIAKERAAIYQFLVYNNIDHLFKNVFPRLFEALGEDKWQQLVSDFIKDHGSQTVLFFEITDEFIEYLWHERKVTDDPPWLNELAHFEWAGQTLQIANEIIDFTVIDTNSDLINAVPVMSPYAWLLRYHFPFDLLPQEPLTDKPLAEPIYFIVCRNLVNQIILLKIPLIAARFFELLKENNTLTGQEILQQIAKEANATDRETVINYGRTILKEWKANNILLGGLK